MVHPQQHGQSLPVLTVQLPVRHELARRRLLPGGTLVRYVFGHGIDGVSERPRRREDRHLKLGSILARPLHLRVQVAPAAARRGATGRPEQGVTHSVTHTRAPYAVSSTDSEPVGWIVRSAGTAASAAARDG